MEEVAEANVRHTMSCLLQYSARIREKAGFGDRFHLQLQLQTAGA